MIQARLRPCLVVGIFAILIAASSADAGENKWTSQGPFSGAVTALANDPQSLPPDVTVFAGIDGGGVYRSDDGGETWVEDNGGLTDLRVQDLEVVVDIMVEPTSAEPSILYAATNGGGLFRATITAAGVPLAWTAINGTDPTDLKNPFVLSVEVDPNEPFILYAGTNGGGTFRSLDTGATWEEINDGLGQRVIFDLEIPIPTQLEPVINEINADVDGSGLGGGAELGEFIELKGQPFTSFAGLSLVFYDAADAHVDADGNCLAFEDFDGFDDGYDFVDVSGTFDSNGLFVVANDASVPNADIVVPFDLQDDTTAVALHEGSGGFFIGLNASTLNLLDVAIYGVLGSAFDKCIQPALGLGTSALNQSTDFGAGSSVARIPDGGDRPGPDDFGSVGITPGQLNVEIENLFVATDLNGVYRTDERRVTGRLPEWFPIDNNLSSDVVFSLAVDGSEAVGCGLLGQSTPYLGTSNAGVFVGTDPCDLVLLPDWLQINESLPDPVTIRAMEISPPLGPVPSMIFAGSEDGRIYRRVTTETTWDEVFNGLEGVMVDAVDIYQRDGTQLIFAGTANDITSQSPLPDGLGGGIFASIDSGANWFQTGPRVDAISGIFAEDVEIDPTDTTVLFAGTFGGGFFRSDDSGQTWVEKNTGIPTSSIDGISRFINTVAVGEDMAMMPVLYTGTDLDGVFKSIDSGDTWFAVNTGLTDTSIHDLEVDPADVDTVYAATGRLFQSTNGGGTWAQISNPGGVSNGFPTNVTIRDLEIDPASSMTLYAATENKGVFKSVDGGANWVEINLGLSEDFVRSLAIDPNNNSTIYAGTDGGGIFKSSDGGLQWLPFNEGLENLFVLSLAIDAMSSPIPGAESDIIYVGTGGGGVFRSTDAGAVWAPFNTGLTNFDVGDVEIDPTDSRIRYAATFGGGVFDFQEVERVTIVPASGLMTTEAGGTASFTAVLTASPIADVTLNLRSSNEDEGTVSPETLLFTPANGTTPQTVTITGVDDGILDSDQAYVIITDPLESFDPRFNGVDPVDVSVTNEALLPVSAGFSVVPIAGLVTDENGLQANFTVALTSTPVANVTVTLASSDTTEGTVSPTTLTFTPGNAQNPQVVTVSGVSDGIVDGNVLYTIDLDPATSADTDYDGLDPNDVSVTNLDNGVAATTLFETATLGATGQTGTGFIANSTTFLGAKFTILQTVDVTGLGGHFVRFGSDGTIFVAIFPLLGGSDLPATPFNAGNAVFSTTLSAPATSNEVLINASFQLTPGRYGILFGSGAFGATGTALAPGNDSDIGGPEYFVSTNGGASYTNGSISNTRFFLNGDVTPIPGLIFTDGFESSNLSSWSLAVP